MYRLVAIGLKIKSFCGKFFVSPTQFSLSLMQKFIFLLLSFLHYFSHSPLISPSSTIKETPPSRKP